MFTASIGIYSEEGGSDQDGFYEQMVLLDNIVSVQCSWPVDFDEADNPTFGFKTLCHTAKNKTTRGSVSLTKSQHHYQSEPAPCHHPPPPSVPSCACRRSDSRDYYTRLQNACCPGTADTASTTC